MLDVDFVITVHDEIIKKYGGLGGISGGGRGAIESALYRVQSYAQYADLDDVLGIAALYAEAIARGHVFNDANKRTGLACALTYLGRQGLHVSEDANLEEVMVALANGSLSWSEFAIYLGDAVDQTPPDAKYAPAAG